MRDRKSVLRCGMLSAAMSAAFAVQAEESFQLGRVEVTAEKGLPAAASERLEADELRDENRETVGDALDLLPGVTMSNFGARNEQTLYLRGYDMRQVPVFIDGIPVYVPYDGYVDLGRFTTYDLAEIDVTKGFSSVLYGPNTLGGAINLVSRRPQKAFEGEVGAGYSTGEKKGSDGTRAWANLGSNQGKWYAQFSASYLDQDAYAMSGDFVPQAYEDGGLRNNAYRTDTKGSLKLGYTPNATDEYAVGYVNQQGEKGTPPYAGTDPTVKARYWQWPYWNKESLYLVTRTALSGGSYVKGRLYYDIFKNSLYSYDDATYTTQTRPYAFQSWYDDHSYGGSLEYGKPLDRHLLKTAVHYKLDHHEEHDAGQPIRTFEDQTASVAFEDTYTLNQDHYLVAGVSYDARDSLRAEDYNSATGIISDFPSNKASAWNPQIGWFGKLGQADEARLTLSRKTRFPTIKDRYSYRLGSAIPNPDLQPEKATTVEAGWVHRFGKVARLDTAIFYSEVRDLIQSVDLTPSTYQLQNIGKVINQGVELSAQAWLGDAVEVGGNYTYLKRDNKSSDLKLTDVPDNKLLAHLTWHVTRPLSITASVQSEGERYSSTDGVRKAKAFTVYGLRAGYEFGRGLTGRFGVENLTDENYAYQEGYPEAGRTWYGNLNYRF